MYYFFRWNYREVRVINHHTWVFSTSMVGRNLNMLDGETTTLRLVTSFVALIGGYSNGHSCWKNYPLL